MIKLVRTLISLLVLYIVIVVVLNTAFIPNNYRTCSLDCLKPDSDCLVNLKCQKSDVIVVLSGGDTIARTDYGIELFQAGIANNILFVGAAADGSASNASVMAAHAIKNGVPMQNILVEEESRNTCENAKKAEKIIKDNNWKEITLVTSAYHQRRALGEFKKSFDGTYDIYNAPLKKDKDWSSSSWFVSPKSWWLATQEFVGWLRQLGGWSC